MATPGPATFGDLINRVKALLYGFTWDQEQYTYLTASMLSTDTSMTVNDVTAISRGLVEVDQELINVQAINPTTNTITIFPFGRGFYGSTAATHASNTAVVNNSKFPIIRCVDAINDIIAEVYPSLFVVGEYEFPKNAVQYNYPLPATVDQVLNVHYQTIGPSLIWPPMRRWRFDPVASVDSGTSLGTTGKSIECLEEVTPGRTIKVTYVTRPSTLANLTDGFAAVSGLPESAKDAIIYGAAAKLLVVYDAARLQMDSIEASERAALTQPTSASNSSKFFMGIYENRLDLEAKKLRDLYPSYGVQSS
jgi:hypothetical protein